MKDLFKFNTPLFIGSIQSESIATSPLISTPKRRTNIVSSFSVYLCDKFISLNLFKLKFNNPKPVSFFSPHFKPCDVKETIFNIVVNGYTHSLIDLSYFEKMYSHDEFVLSNLNNFYEDFLISSKLKGFEVSYSNFETFIESKRGG